MNTPGGEKDVAPLPVTPELAARLKEWGVPLEAPYISRYREWEQAVTHSIASEAATVSIGNDHKIKWRVMSRNSNLCMEFNPDETIHVVWRFDRIDALLYPKQRKGEETLAADLTIREIGQAVWHKIAVVIQARWADQAADDIMRAEDDKWLNDIRKEFGDPDKL